MRGAEAGTCEADGFCSFEDPTCMSGRRYGGHSGSVGGSCVPLIPAETSGNPSSTGSGGSSSEGGSVTTFDPSTAGESSGVDALTSGAETGSTGGAGATLTTTTDAESSTSESSSDPTSETGASTTSSTTTGATTDPGPVCGSPFLDEFEDGNLPGWQTTTDAGPVGVVAGTLQFSIDGDSSAYSNVFGGPFDVEAEEGFIQMTVADAPSDPSVDLTLMFRESLDPSESHSVRLRGANLVRASSSVGDGIQVEVPNYASIAVRLRWDEGMVLHEYALDGGEWILLLEEAPAFSPFAGYISILGGTFTNASDVVAVESIEGCFSVL